MECIPINSTNPITPNGSITLSIKGGTSPYTILWNNGQQGKTLTNLLPGSYSALIIDYFGDFNVSVNCEVGFNNPLPSITPTPTLTPTPTTPTQPTLCLSNGVDLTYTFNPSGLDSNNNYVWSSSSLIMSFDIVNNRWNITSWEKGGVMIQTTNLLIPIGEWINLGELQNNNWNVSLGGCLSIFPLQLTVTKTDESCFNCSDGVVYVTATGGVPTYQYRIYGFGIFPNYQTFGLFTGLYSGEYLIEVLDSNGNTAITTFTINVS